MEDPLLPAAPLMGLQPTAPSSGGVSYYQARNPPAAVPPSVYQPAPAMTTQPMFQLQSHQLGPPPQPAAQTQPSALTQLIYQPMPISQGPAPQVFNPHLPQYTMLQSPYSLQLPRQPVPVPELPKLVCDSEREFTDLKMAFDHLLGTHIELS